MREKVLTLKDLIGVNSLRDIQDIVRINFKARRKGCKITQKELAKKTGVSLGTIKRFEQTGNISLSTLILLSSVLEIDSSFEELFTKKSPIEVRKYFDE